MQQIADALMQSDCSRNHGHRHIRSSSQCPAAYQTATASRDHDKGIYDLAANALPPQA